MNKSQQGRVRCLAVTAAGAVAFALTVPTPAFATSAFDILIPKPAEFIPALIAFVVIWAVLAKLVWPSVIKTLDARQKAIQDNLDASEQAKVDAAKALKKAEATIDDAQAQADEIVAEAKKNAEASKDAIIKQANIDAKRIQDKARDGIEAERHAAMADLVDQAADLAVDLAGKIIGENLDAETQKRLIERLLAEAGDADGNQ
ncbi:F0F1 ATP synthase subunit B [Atopobiaceae bacterium FL090493]|nr:F0F1 ATP synthase subunit B [Atopobiaceae bacterium FL090493]